MKQSHDFFVAEKSILASNVGQNTVEILKVDRHMVRLFNFPDNVLAETRWKFVGKAARRQGNKEESENLNNKANHCKKDTNEGYRTHLLTRYSSNTDRSFCAGAQSEEKAARRVIGPVALSMLEEMRRERMLVEFILNVLCTKGCGTASFCCQGFGLMPVLSGFGCNL